MGVVLHYLQPLGAHEGTFAAFCHFSTKGKATAAYIYKHTHIYTHTDTLIYTTDPSRPSQMRVSPSQMRVTCESPRVRCESHAIFTPTRHLASQIRILTSPRRVRVLCESDSHTAPILPSPCFLGLDSFLFVSSALFLVNKIAYTSDFPTFSI